ncbi:MAG TPA: hypothetical protein VFN61_10755 [Acidimicrobiales bacterium]|nr:hypothetical protein [Acidimicrobiales bacterium]
MPRPNINDVNQAAVKTTKKLGPFVFSLSKSFAGWPSACPLLNGSQLHHLFPAIVSLHGAPVGTRAEIMGSGKKTPRPTDCEYNLNTTFEPAGYGNTVSWVDVSVQGADSGTPQIWNMSWQQQKSTAHKYPEQYAYYPSLLGGTRCFYDGNGLECLKGDIDFWVGGDKVTDGNFQTVDEAMWLDQVVIPTAEVVAAEVRTAP